MGYLLPASLQKVYNSELAINVETIYLAFIHVPLHYHRLQCLLTYHSILFLSMCHIIVYVGLVLLNNYYIEYTENVYKKLHRPIGAIICSHIIWNLHIDPSPCPTYLNYTSYR